MKNQGLGSLGSWLRRGAGDGEGQESLAGSGQMRGKPQHDEKRSAVDDDGHHCRLLAGLEQAALRFGEGGGGKP
jgi:hypothetical protein